MRVKAIDHKVSAVRAAAVGGVVDEPYVRPAHNANAIRPAVLVCHEQIIEHEGVEVLLHDVVHVHVNPAG